MTARAWLLSLTLCAPLANALDMAGVRFAETRELDGRTLVLNGAGLREYGWMKIDVYAAALWLPAPALDADALLSSPELKLIEVHLLRDASAETTREAWRRYLDANCVAPCVLPQAQTARFLALLPPTVRGDVQSYRFENDRVTLHRNGALIGEVEGGDFARRLLATWIGAVPTSEHLKRALLGARHRDAQTRDPAGVRR